MSWYIPYYWIYFLLRLCQFLFSAAALCILFTAFPDTNDQFRSTTRVGSGAVHFALLMTYTGAMYAIIHLVIIDCTHWVSRPILFVERVIDFVLGIVLLLAAVGLTISDFVTNCSSYGYHIKCPMLSVAVGLTYGATVTFLLSTILSIWLENEDDNNMVLLGRHEHIFHRPLMHPTTQRRTQNVQQQSHRSRDEHENRHAMSPSGQYTAV